MRLIWWRKCLIPNADCSRDSAARRALWSMIQYKCFGVVVSLFASSPTTIRQQLIDFEFKPIFTRPLATMSSDSVVYHYLAIGKLGRGEVVKWVYIANINANLGDQRSLDWPFDRLFLKDAGIDFEEKRYKYPDTWPETSEKLKQQGITRTGSLPSLEYKGLILTQVYKPILQLWRNTDILYSTSQFFASCLATSASMMVRRMRTSTW